MPFATRPTDTYSKGWRSAEPVPKRDAFIVPAGTTINVTTFRVSSLPVEPAIGSVLRVKGLTYGVVVPKKDYVMKKGGGEAHDTGGQAGVADSFSLSTEHPRDMPPPPRPLALVRTETQFVPSLMLAPGAAAAASDDAGTVKRPAGHPYMVFNAGDIVFVSASYKAMSEHLQSSRRSPLGLVSDMLRDRTYDSAKYLNGMPSPYEQPLSALYAWGFQRQHFWARVYAGAYVQVQDGILCFKGARDAPPLVLTTVPVTADAVYRKQPQQQQGTMLIGNDDAEARYWRAIPVSSADGNWVLNMMAYKAAERFGVSDPQDWIAVARQFVSNLCAYMCVSIDEDATNALESAASTIEGAPDAQPVGMVDLRIIWPETLRWAGLRVSPVFARQWMAWRPYADNAEFDGVTQPSEVMLSSPYSQDN